MRSTEEQSSFVHFRFESPAAFARHLQRPGGFLLPDPELARTALPRVAVEVAFERPAPGSLLHGTVRERRAEGVALDLLGATLSLALTQGERVHPRYATDFCAELRAGRAPLICRVLDLGAGGMRVAAATFDACMPGERVEVALLLPEGALELEAHTVWMSRREAGLQFTECPPRLETALARLRRRWAKAHRIDHATACSCSADPGDQFSLASGQRQP